VPLDNFAIFVDKEDGFFVADGAAAKPTARMSTTRLFGRQ